MAAPRVLILDETYDGWAPVTRALREAGHGSLVSAANDSAVELVTACEAEVIVLALASPVRPTLDLLRKVKAASPETEAIVTAAEDAPLDDAIEALRSGADDVIRKPSGPCGIVPAVLAAIERRRKARGIVSLMLEGQRLVSVRDRERLPGLLVDLVQRAMKADVVSLMLRDTVGRLYVAGAHGLSGDLLGSTRLHVGQRMAGRIADLRTPVVIDDSLAIVYPLLSEGRLLGVLSVGRSAAGRRFKPEDLPLAGVVASQVVLALETLRERQRTGMVERLSVVGQIASSLVHEINNPLAAVVGQSDLALESVNDTLALLDAGGAVTADEVRSILVDVRQRLEDSQVATGALQAIARDLRAAVQSEAGFEQLFDLADSIRAAVRLSTGELRRQTSLVWAVERRLFVVGDSGQLCQVFLSLIHHANQAMRDAGTAAPELRISSARVDGGFRIDVADNGPGIAPEQMAQIFEPFHVAKGRGAGLALSTAHDVVQAFGGYIEVSSRLGQGAMFSVHLPSAPIPEAQAATHSHEPGLCGCTA